jgi:Phytanoyl-CoA dioxygenase (PhyH)
MSEPRVSFAPGTDPATQVAEAVAVLQREGLVVIDDLTDPALLAQAWGEIEANYPDLAKEDRASNYGPYEGRHTMPMVVEGTLADPAVLLPKPVAQIARDLLDPEFKVDSVGLLVAFPGAPDQARHADAWLFPGTPLDRLLPPFALAFATPLVAMDETTGRTAFWRGTHRTGTNEPKGDWDYAPVVQPGSAIIWDFRVWHAGLANNSADPRPVIFTVLAREWWIEIEPPEAVHYDKLKIARDVHAALTPKWQQRFRRAKIVDPLSPGKIDA